MTERDEELGRARRELRAPPHGEASRTASTRS